MEKRVTCDASTTHNSGSACVIKREVVGGLNINPKPEASRHNNSASATQCGTSCVLCCDDNMVYSLGGCCCMSYQLLVPFGCLLI